MPTSCVVGGCTRNSIKNPETHFYQFPRDPANNTRKDFTFLARSRPLICSAHFSEDCRERSSALKESLGLKSKYRLKTGSIPTLKAPNIESTRASASTTALIITCVGTSRSCRMFPNDFINFVIYLFIYCLSFCRLYRFIRICHFLLSISMYLFPHF